MNELFDILNEASLTDKGRQCKVYELGEAQDIVDMLDEASTIPGPVYTAETVPVFKLNGVYVVEADMLNKFMKSAEPGSLNNTSEAYALKTLKEFNELDDDIVLLFNTKESYINFLNNAVDILESTQDVFIKQDFSKSIIGLKKTFEERFANESYNIAFREE